MLTSLSTNYTASHCMNTGVGYVPSLEYTSSLYLFEIIYGIYLKHNIRGNIIVFVLCESDGYVVRVYAVFITNRIFYGSRFQKRFSLQKRILSVNRSWSYWLVPITYNEVSHKVGFRLRYIPFLIVFIVCNTKRLYISLTIFSHYYYYYHLSNHILLIRYSPILLAHMSNWKQQLLIVIKIYICRNYFNFSLKHFENLLLEY